MVILIMPTPYGGKQKSQQETKLSDSTSLSIDTYKIIPQGFAPRGKRTPTISS